MARKYSSTSIDTTIVSTALSTSATSISVASAADLTNGMGYSASDTFMIALSPDTATEEICIVTNVSSNTLTVTRAQAGTAATAHPIGSVLRHVLTSVELSDFETVKTNYITASSTSTVTNKTVNLTSNTLTGTTAQFNTALSDNDFATQAGTETLTNKTISASSNTLTGVATTAGTETLTNKTIALGSNTVSGTIAQFNTAVTDADLATLAGTETLTNKNIRLAGIDEKTGNYTLVVGDSGKLISVNSSSNLTVTVPSGLFSAGDVIYVTRTGTGTVTIAASGTTLTSPDSNLKLRARYSSAAIICTASNTFRIVGDLGA
jgi:hypothetical protein